MFYYIHLFTVCIEVNVFHILQTVFVNNKVFRICDLLVVLAEETQERKWIIDWNNQNNGRVKDKTMMEYRRLREDRQEDGMDWTESG